MEIQYSQYSNTPTLQISLNILNVFLLVFILVGAKLSNTDRHVNGDKALRDCESQISKCKSEIWNPRFRVRRGLGRKTKILYMRPTFDLGLTMLFHLKFKLSQE